MKLYLLLFACVFSSLILLFACKKEPEANDPKTNTNSLVKMLQWNFSSVPLRFAESGLTNNTAYGFNRAKIAWYNIDPSVFYTKSLALRPPNITNNDMSDDDCRVIWVNELFPSKENEYDTPLSINVFNVDYYPSGRGSWNFDTKPSAYSAGIGTAGILNEPSGRWAGITRKLEMTDYKINYIDFWLMDPFATYADAEGELYFDLGEISEDILKDGMISAENTIDGTVATSVWGLVKPLSGINSFSVTNPHLLDTGLDELLNKDEPGFFSAYLDEIHLMCEPAFYTSTLNDPANDDYHSYLGDDYDQLNYKVRDRYKNFNGGDQNSFPGTNGTNVLYQRTPNTEDINSNGFLDTLNTYFEYKIKIDKESFATGSNYIVDVFESGIHSGTKLENGKMANSMFYHFRIPLTDFSAIYGTPNLTSNPKFIRIYLTGFSSPVNLRFINLMFSEEVIDYAQYQQYPISQFDANLRVPVTF